MEINKNIEVKDGNSLGSKVFPLHDYDKISLVIERLDSHLYSNGNLIMLGSHIIYG